MPLKVCPARNTKLVRVACSGSSSAAVLGSPEPAQSARPTCGTTSSTANCDAAEQILHQQQTPQPSAGPLLVWVVFMKDTAEQDEPVAPSEVSAALEWNRVEENRRRRRRQVARLKARQRTVDINEWAGRNSRSAKLQVAVKKGLRDWFEAARNGSGGVPCGVLIDAVITLGLSHDLKQVKRTVIGAADPSNGQLCTIKIFSTALLACCCSDLSKDRLFRSLREEEDWRLFGTNGGGREASPEVAAPVQGTPSSAMPAFLTQLTAYRRKLLMATVADKFPTPCMSSFWTPDHETAREPGTLLSVTFETNSADKVRSPTTAVASREPAHAWPGLGCGGRRQELQRRGNSKSSGQVKASLLACGIQDDDGHADLAISSPEDFAGEAARPASVEAQKRYRVVSEAFFGVEARGQLQYLAPAPEDPPWPSQTEEGPQRHQAGRMKVPPQDSDGDGYGGSNRALSSKTTKLESTNKRRPQQWEVGGEIVRDTAGRLRDSMVRKEQHLTGSEARWGDYQVMKKRWRRRTPASILMDDRMDEADRVYSRVSRPSTREGNGSNHRGSAVSGSANSSRVCSASTCQRPSTAPAGTIADGSSWRLTTLGTSSVVTSRSITSGRCLLKKTLPLGPIPLDEGRKLRYPLLQMEREKTRTATKTSAGRNSACSAAAAACGNFHPDGDQGPNGSRCLRRYVHIPMTRDGKGRWNPRLVKVPCGPQC